MARVLVIDEDQATRADLEDVLTRAGHQVQSTIDAIVGIVMMERGLPDVVLVDAAVNHWDAEVFAWTLRHHLRLMRVAVVLMQEPFTLSSSSLRSLSTAVLAKPIDPERVLDLVGGSRTFAAA